MEGAGWLSSSFRPPAKTEMVDEAKFPKPAPKPSPMAAAAASSSPSSSSSIAEIGPNMSGIRSDKDLSSFLSSSKARANAAAAAGAGSGGGAAAGGASSRSTSTSTSINSINSKGGAGVAVVEFATAWCVKCHEMFPTFYRLSKKYPQHSYAVAQIETLSAASSKGLRYTPTFRFYSPLTGRQVDEVVGKEPRRLEDHLWLHSD